LIIKLNNVSLIHTQTPLLTAIGGNMQSVGDQISMVYGRDIETQVPKSSKIIKN